MSNVIRAFANGQSVQWKYLDSTKWNTYSRDGGPKLGASHHETTHAEIEWRVKENRHKLPINKELVEAFANGAQLEWKSNTQDWSIYRGGICLTSPEFGVEWRVQP